MKLQYASVYEMDENGRYSAHEHLLQVRPGRDPFTAADYTHKKYWHHKNGNHKGYLATDVWGTPLAVRLLRLGVKP